MCSAQNAFLRERGGRFSTAMPLPSAATMWGISANRSVRRQAHCVALCRRTALSCFSEFEYREWMTATNGYEYDIFLSYPVDSLVGEWLRNHFLPVLTEKLDSAAPNLTCSAGPKMMFVIWDNKLKQAHSRSRVMIAVLTPLYFYKSEWCPIEWHTMMQREQLSKVGNHLNGTDSLICPVLFSDGECLPDEARRITNVDFRKWAFPEPVFRHTPDYIVFRQKDPGAS
jgi:hypothetical protein